MENNPRGLFQKICKSWSTHRIRLDNSQHDRFFAAPEHKNTQQLKLSQQNDRKTTVTVIYGGRQTAATRLALVKWNETPLAIATYEKTQLNPESYKYTHRLFSH